MDTADPADASAHASCEGQGLTELAETHGERDRAVALAALCAAQDEFDACVQRLVGLRGTITRADSTDAAGTAQRDALLTYYDSAWDALRAARARWRAHILACEAAGSGAAVRAPRVDADIVAAHEAVLPHALPRLRFARWLVDTGRLTDWPPAA